MVIPRWPGPSDEERERIRRAFLGMALCHELKQPLHSLNLNVELLSKRVERLTPPADDRAQLDAPLLALGRVVDRVSDCLDAFALRSAPDPVPSEARDPRQLLEGAVERARVLAAPQGVRVALDAPDDVPQLPFAPAQLAVALDALLVNAVRATRDSRHGGEVVLAVRPGDEELRLEIIDRGVGMSPDVARRAFEIGFSTWGGEGMGLTVAKFVAYHHSGGFSMASEAGKGTTISMVLPLTPEIVE